jgi:hypothetical protein
MEGWVLGYEAMGWCVLDQEYSKMDEQREDRACVWLLLCTLLEYGFYGAGGGLNMYDAKICLVLKLNSRPQNGRYRS